MSVWLGCQRIGDIEAVVSFVGRWGAAANPVGDKTIFDILLIGIGRHDFISTLKCDWDVFKLVT